MKTVLLYPFSLIYRMIIGIRNRLFDMNILPVKSFDFPVISVGNLSVGGTGKTPHVEFLITILKDNWNVAVLSRGYKRKTKGFLMADEQTDNQKIGDESYQIYKKFPEITVAVSEKRVNGIKAVLKEKKDTQVFLLDDAFQHRYVKPGLSLLLTDYNNLYINDKILPLGTLRESVKNAQRADTIIVSKCPETITAIEMRSVEIGLNIKPYQSLFFSRYVYDEIKAVFEDSVSQNWTLSEIKKTDKSLALVTGIANTHELINFIEKYTSKIEPFSFPDHYNFKPKDYKQIAEKVDQSDAVVLVTEKDAARLVNDKKYPESLKKRTFSIAVRVEILQDKEKIFIQKVQNYVTEDSRNS